MPTYPDDELLGDARARYFAEAGLGEGGYQDRWVKLELGPVPFRIPNTKGRVRAVRLHDVHHVLTGYGTDWLGEAEIGAFEVASGCGDHWAAWYLNLSAMLIGIAIDQSAVLRAFARGRRSRNLYTGEWDEALLGETLGSLRERLELAPAVGSASASDRLAFAAWSVAGLVWILSPSVLLVSGLVWLLH